MNEPMWTDTEMRRALDELADLKEQISLWRHNYSTLLQVLNDENNQLRATASRLAIQVLEFEEREKRLKSRWWQLWR